MPMWLRDTAAAAGLIVFMVSTFLLMGAAQAFFSA